MRRISQAAGLAVIAVIVAVISCTDLTTTTQDGVITVGLSSDLTTLQVGQTVQVTALAANLAGVSLSNVDFVWNSSNQSVATVSDKGLVTAVAPGASDISATADNKTASVTITVVTAATNTLSFSTQPSSSVQSGVVFGQSPAVQLRLGTTPISQSGVTVTAEIATGGGTLNGTLTAITNAAGIASFTNLSIAGAVGTRTLTFSAPEFGTLTSANINVTPGPPASMSIVAQPSSSAESDVVLVSQPSVQLFDASSNSITQSGIVVSASLSNGTGTLNGTKNASTNSSGVATFSGLSITGNGSYTIDFSGTGMAPVTSDPIAVAPPPPTSIVFGIQPSASAQNGVAFGQQPTIQLRQGASPLAQAGVIVSVAIATGGGTLGGTTTATTNASGLATFSNLSVTGTVGPRSLSFSAPGFGALTSGNISLTPGPVAELNITAQPSTPAVTSVAFATQPSVQLRDGSANVVNQPGVAVTVSLASGTGTLNGSKTVTTNTSGIATFAGLSITGTGSFTLGFIAPNVQQAVSNAVDVTPAPSLAIATQPSSSAQSGVAFGQQPVIQLRSGAGPLAQAGVVVTASIASGGGTLVGTTTATTDASGLATFTNLRISGTIGTRTLNFAASGFGTVTSGNISLSAGPAATLSVATQPSSTAQTGVAFATQPSIQLRDASTNVVSQAGVVVTVSLATGTGTLNGTNTATTDGGGLATFSGLSITGSGTYSLRFVATGLTQATSTTISISTPPPPGGVGEPVYDAATDQLIVVDSLNSYTGITSGASPFSARYPSYRALNTSDDPMPMSTFVSLVPGRTGQAVRLSYGGPSGASDIIVGTEGRLSAVGRWNGTLPKKAGPYAHFYFTTWIRFSVGADPAYSTDGFNDSGVKGVMIWNDGGTGNERYQHSPHRLENFNGGRYDETRWDASSPHPPNSVTKLNHWRTADGAAPKFAPYADGAWHRFTVEIYGGDPVHKGERWWLDGVLVFDNMDNVGDIFSWAGPDGSHSYAYTAPVTHWMVFGNYVRGDIAAKAPPFTVDFDDWIAWTK